VRGIARRLGGDGGEIEPAGNSPAACMRRSAASISPMK
jgi:hypothetical protein